MTPAEAPAAPSPVGASDSGWPALFSSFADEWLAVPANVFTVFGDSTYCRLGDHWFRGSHEEHLAVHMRELARWRKQRQAEAERVRIENLRRAQEARRFLKEAA